MKVTTSSAPPSSEDEGTGDDESEEVVDGVNGQTTSFRSLRSSSCCSRTMSFFISKHTFQNSNLELSGDHGLDGVYGVGQLGKRLGLVLARTTSQQARVHDRLAWDSTSRFHITIPHRSDVRDSPLTAGSDEYRSTADLLPFPEGEVDEVRHP